MATAINRLTARKVSTETKPGRHADGAGLYLIVDESGAKRWLFMFRWQGKLKEMGLGGTTSVPLAQARDFAADARRVLAGGKNPIEVRRTDKASFASKTTFGVFADQLVADISSGFRNSKHRAQWKMTLTVYAAPLRPKALGEINTTHILDVLKPIWSTKPETASRVRGRIERVLDAAKAKGLREGENPARWRGHLDQLLPKRQKLTRGHHAAMPYAEVPAFMAKLRKRKAMSALALEFCILNASRTNEVLSGKWPEVDRKAKIWTIPAERMKAGREHRVPLTARGIEITDAVQKLKSGDLIFPGQKAKRPLSETAMSNLLGRLGVDTYTVHGFRSAFRDWVEEQTSFPGTLAEAALAHVVGDETERAYRRGDVLDKRRKLMTAWAEYCMGHTKLKTN